MNRILVVLLFMTIYGFAFAANADTAPRVVTISLNEDVISFAKGTVWVAGVFLAIFAFIGVAFFGWDVHKARTSIAEAQKEIKQRLEEMRKDSATLKEMKEQLEQTGAQIQEDMEKNQPTPAPASDARCNLDLIREVLSTSNYTWTTVGRIMKRTGLDRETILREVRSSPDIAISFGRQSQDHIFRFKNEG